MNNTKEINELIKQRAEKIKKERGLPESSIAKARLQILKNLSNVDKAELALLTKSTNLIDLQTYLHAYTSLTVPAIEAFLSLVGSPATEDSFEAFCSTWGIH